VPTGCQSPYRAYLPEALKLGPVVEQNRGVRIRDLDGNWRYDLGGSYGVNVFGYDLYKQCIEEGIQQVRDLGPVLWPYHPLIRDDAERIRVVSGLEEVSFHISGTEACRISFRMPACVRSIGTVSSSPSA
jgi:glutamate-1-semialdehyde 2,1-aminomutase